LLMVLDRTRGRPGWRLRRCNQTCPPWTRSMLVPAQAPMLQGALVSATLGAREHRAMSRSVRRHTYRRATTGILQKSWRPPAMVGGSSWRTKTARSSSIMQCTQGTGRLREGLLSVSVKYFRCSVRYLPKGPRTLFRPIRGAVSRRARRADVSAAGDLR
jgi:hypothetical protein